MISSLDFWYRWNRSKQYAAQLRRMPPSVSAHSWPSARIAEVNIHYTTMIRNEAVGICVSKLGYGFKFRYLYSETLITLTDSSSFWRGLMESRFAPWVQLVVHTTPCHGLLAHWPQYRLGIYIYGLHGKVAAKIISLIHKSDLVISPWYHLQAVCHERTPPKIPWRCWSCGQIPPASTISGQGWQPLICVQGWVRCS